MKVLADYYKMQLKSLRCLCAFALFIAIFSTAIPVEAVDNPPQVLSAPVKYSANYPCKQCHVPDEVTSGQDDIKVHAAIRIIDHIEADYGCSGCHDMDNPGLLLLFNGDRISVADSSKLCGQCHSTVHKLWISGLHGKVKGGWNGTRKISPCTCCHNPHQPAYRPVQPEPPPTPPEKTLRWKQ